MPEVKKGFLSVILLQYNMKGLVGAALDSLKEQDYPEDKFEVIVLDNDSTDGADDWVEKNYPWVRLIRTGKNWGYAGMNVGYKEAKGEYLFFLNNDLTFKKDCLSKMMEAVLELPDDVAIVTPLRRDAKTDGPSYHRKIISRSFYTCSVIDPDPKKYYEDGFTGFPLFKRKVLDEMPYFIDPDYFMYAEDVDFCYRTRMMGYRSILVTDAIVYNIGRATSKVFMGSARINYYNERNLLATFIKDVQLRNLIIYLPYVLLMRIASLCVELLSFRFKNFATKLKAYGWVLRKLPYILKKRGPVQRLRKVSDRQIFKVIGDEKIFLKYVLKDIFRK